MSIARDFPFEVLTNIFQHLPQQSLKECQIVCKSWQGPANWCFLEHITFQYRSNVTGFLNTQTTSNPNPIYYAVKKITLPQGRRGPLQRVDVQRLMTKVPNLEELELNNRMISLFDLNNVELPPNLNSINFNDACYHTLQDVHDYMAILKKQCGTIKKFNISNRHIFREYFLNNDMTEFFGVFLKLTELDIGTRQDLEECLPIIRPIFPTLKSLRFTARNDIDDANLNITVNDRIMLSTLEKLDIKTDRFHPRTYTFIANNCIGLNEITTKFDTFIIDNLNHSDALVEYLEFVNFTSSYNVKFKTTHDFYLECLTNSISNSFTMLPANSENSSMHLYVKIDIGNRITHRFDLSSERDYCNRIKRTFNWNFTFRRNERRRVIDECIGLIVGIINVNTFTFDARGHLQAELDDFYNLILQKLNITESTTILHD